MSTISQNLSKIITAKENLRQKLNDVGVTVNTSAPFSSYPTYINSIPIPSDDISSLVNGSVRRVSIPNNVKKIRKFAFSDCDELQTVVMPNNIEIIDEYAFADCSNIISITIPSTVTDIRSDAFSGCYRLVEVINLSNLTITAGTLYNGQVGLYANDVFTSNDYTSKITNNNGHIIYNNIEYIGYHPSIGDIVQITIPNGITSLHAAAFYGYKTLTSITLNENITNLPDKVFNNCTNLAHVIIPSSTVCSCSNNSIFLDVTQKVKIHVPEELISSYTSASIWSQFYSSNKVEFIAIE